MPDLDAGTCTPEKADNFVVCTCRRTISRSQSVISLFCIQNCRSVAAAPCELALIGTHPRIMQGQQLRSCSVRRADVFGSRLAAHRHSARPASQRMAARADSVLIINTKGGGHAFLGLYLARRLLKDGHTVSILKDGDEVRSHCLGVLRSHCLYWL